MLAWMAHNQQASQLTCEIDIPIPSCTLSVASTFAMVLTTLAGRPCNRSVMLDRSYDFVVHYKPCRK